MSSGDQQLRDNMKLVGDANLEGRVAALESVQADVLERLSRCTAIVDGNGSPTDRMLARGATKELGGLLDAVQALIDDARSARDS
jgi:hypothetical protein